VTVNLRFTIALDCPTPTPGQCIVGVASEWSIPLMTGMHRSGPRQGSQPRERRTQAY